MLDREAEWREFEAAKLAEGRCPYGGGVLHRDGNAGPDWASCDVCDCFGFYPEEAKVWPRPLRIVRWKVIRKKCDVCGKSFAADKFSGTCCLRCLAEALGHGELSDFFNPF